jgi:membrane protease YdiL (CAAX protease family)
MMFGSDYLETSFVVTAFLFHIVLIIHFAIRKWRFDLAIRYGPIVYALSIPALVVSVLLLLGGKTWSLWLGGLLYFIWAIYGYFVEYIRKIEWRNPICWSIFLPYVALYLSTIMFYWFPLLLVHKALWYVYALLYIISTILNVTSHKKPNLQWMKSKPKFPWLYLFLAYGWTWLFWIPVALTRQDYQESPMLLAVVFLGVFGPGIAGIVLTYRELGKAGGRDFWRRVFDVRRISFQWWALILLLYPALHLTAITINRWLGGSPPQFAFVREAISMPAGIPIVVILYLLQAGLEELGWRGYLLDRLQAIWKPLTASLVLGVVHAFWHLPLFWVVGTNQNRYLSGMDFSLFVAFVIAASLYSTWCYNDNRRSTLAVILFHTTGNLALDTFLLPGTGEYLFKAIYVLSAVMIAFAWMLPVRKRKRIPLS